MRKGQHVREHIRTSPQGVTFKAGTGYMRVPLEWEFINAPDTKREHYIGHWKNKYNGAKIWYSYSYGDDIGMGGKYHVVIDEKGYGQHGTRHDDAVSAMKRIMELMNKFYGTKSLEVAQCPK